MHKFTVLHTSDWHLGRMLYARKERTAEHEAFLRWLLQTIEKEAVDALIVAGDIFDSTAPPNASLKMYYDFLLQVRNCGCRHIIITGGNHDSPSLLDAPKELLNALDVKVTGRATEQIEDEVITLKDPNGKPLAIVCAVPFLRERDISRWVSGETYSDRSQRIADSIAAHYAALAQASENKRIESGEDIPVIATGHLSIAGGKTCADDGVRDTYVGAIECVGHDIFPQIFDYVALGHYHIPSSIDSEGRIRYSGSPLPMGFGEAEQRKIALKIEFHNRNRTVTEIPVPLFQRLETIAGDKEHIINRLSELKAQGESVWTEIVYEDAQLTPDLMKWLAEITADSNIEALKVQDRHETEKLLSLEEVGKPLEDLDTHEVFDKLLSDRGITEEQQNDLRLLYCEIINQLNETE